MSNCSICCNTAQNTFHELPCGHAFHADCIIQWFRSGGPSCPLCRNEDAHDLNPFTVRQRAIYLRQVSRAKDAPQNLKKIVNRLKKAEEKVKEKRKVLVDFKKLHKKKLKTLSRLRSNKWRADSHVRSVRTRLGMYSDERFPVPLVKRDSRFVSRHH
jgi:hypothetical protein